MHSVVVVSVILALQLGLIVALLLERRIRRRAELALRASEARAQIAGVSLGVGFWTWEPGHDDVWISEPCARLLGLDRRSKPSLQSFLAVVRPRTGGSLDASFDRALNSGTAFHGEWEIAVRPEEKRWISTAIRAIAGPAGERRVTGALIDVTERHAAERLAAQHRLELAHLARLALVGELSGALAHELNQPLTAILLNARAAQCMLRDDTLQNAELSEILEDIANDDRRAGAVVRKVRSMVKKGPIELQTVSLNEVVEEVLGLMHADLIARGVVAHTRLSLPAPMVNADRVELQQVLMNLIVNACDAMAGTPRDDRTLLVVTSAANGIARIEVRDRGCGIPSDLLDSMFEPFETTKDNGLGLGLAICRSIMAAHEGDVQASNNPDGGATLVVSLPLASA